MKLRDYQNEILDQLKNSCSNDIVQLDTGAGKTPIEAALAEWSSHTLLIAHRNILIQQISEKLAEFGLEHDTISTEHTRRRCMAAHRMHGKNFIRRGHSTRLVASMQSIIAAIRHSRFYLDSDLPWLIVIDEAHHAIPGNMWGMLRTIFPRARIVGFTATPARMDGESLHVDREGLFDRLVQAPSLGNDSTRTLIDRGYLSGFNCYAARTSYNIDDQIELQEHEKKIEDDRALESLDVSIDSGRRRIFKPGRGLDWGNGILQIMGNPVEEYKRLSMGTRAIVMAPSIKNAQLFAHEFRAAGISAACINSTQSPGEIARLLDAFRTGRCMVLTNVDMVGEGFNLPACETLIIATRTASFPRYRQWCGRVLRADEGKRCATIIDLTGMVAEHGMPDESVVWDLLCPPCGPKTRRHIPCDDCGMFFLFKLEFCPGCGWANGWLERHDGFAAGTYEFKLEMIDPALRGYVLRERQQAKNNERLRSELLRAPDGFGNDLLGRTVNALAGWLPEKLKESGIPIVDINNFLISNSARDRMFYMKNFTVEDIKKNKHTKALKVYKKWLKQK